MFKQTHTNVKIVIFNKYFVILILVNIGNFEYLKI